MSSTARALIGISSAFARRSMLAAIAIGCMAFACEGPPEADPTLRRWSVTGPMNEARAEHVAALLPSGKVLVAGGLDHFGLAGTSEWTCLSSAELYDPASGAWADAGSMLGPRCTRGGLIPISKGPYAGKVMVAGGISAYYDKGDAWFYYRLLSTTELFDPAEGTWAPGPPLLKHASSFIQLADGNLLAVGSFVDDSEGPFSAEVQLLALDAPEPAWRFVQPMNYVRYAPSLLLLDNGEVLAVGGLANRSLTDHVSHTAERYDPVSDRWTPAASPPIPRWNPVLVRLPDGTVLLTAGCSHASGCSDPQYPLGPGPDTLAWIYEPAVDVWLWWTAREMHYPRSYAVGTLLDSGKVLVASGNWSRITLGGQVDWYPAPVAEIFDPTTKTWSTTDPLPHYVRCCGAMVKLQSGAVVVSGGYVNTAPGDEVPAIRGAQVFREAQ